MSTTRDRLYIGELAQLVGVSIKTVRHYHKVGLLPEPERSESGYRLYSAEHVRRLRLIRQMRELGLSLAQIRIVIKKTHSDNRLRETLQDVLDEVDEQIEELNQRRERIFQLLSQANLSDEDLDQADSLYLDHAYEKLGHLLPDLDGGFLEQEFFLETVLSRYDWNENLPAFFEGIVAYFQEHPQQYQQFISDLQSIWHRLQSQETEDAVLREGARSFVEKHRAIFDQLRRMVQDTRIQPSFQNVLRDMAGEVIGDTQQRFSRYLFDEYQRFINDRENS